MTTIVAVKTDDKVTFAWDSQITWRGRAMNSADSAGKVFRNGPVVFGVSGRSRTSDILKHMSIPDRKEYAPDYDTETWIVTELVPHIIKELDKVKFFENSTADSESHVILAVDNLVGYLSTDLAWVTDETGIYAVGSGSAYAIGALSTGSAPEQAVRIAKTWDLYTGGQVRTATVEELLA